MDLIYRFNPLAPLVANRPADSAAAVQALLDGNHRLVEFLRQMQKTTLGDSAVDQIVVPIDLLSMGLPFLPNVARDQAPYAIVLGCSDARVPIENVFDQSFNELFVIRIAGNVLGTECLGSFDFAVRSFEHSLRAVVVLGHTGCGAVGAAVDAYTSPGDYAEITFTHALRSLVDRVMLAVRGAAQAVKRTCGPDIDRHPNYRTALIDASVYLNAAITAFDLRRETADADVAGVDVFYGACDINTMRLNSIGSAPPLDAPELGPAPGGSEELAALGERIAAAAAAKWLK